MNALFDRFQRGESDLAHLALNLSKFAPEQQVVVKRCINRYAKQDSFLAVIVQSLYLLLEAHRRLYNQSDWQKAQKVLEEKAFTILPRFPTVYLLGEENIHETSNYLLKKLIKLNDSHTKVPRPLGQFLTENFHVDQLKLLKQSVLDKLTPIASKALEEAQNNLYKQAQKTLEESAQKTSVLIIAMLMGSPL